MAEREKYRYPERYRIMKPAIANVLKMTTEMGIPVDLRRVKQLIRIMTGPVDTRSYKMGVTRSPIFPFQRIGEKRKDHG
jgi:hypothetical protein